MKRKPCSKCGEKKPATTEYFSRNRRARDGLYCQCKVCKAGAAAAYYAGHRDERVAYAAVYNAENREKLRAKSAAYDALHREERRAKSAAYNALHREERRAAAKAKQAQPFYTSVIEHRGLARLLGRECTLDYKSWISLVDGWGWRCLSCGAGEPEVKLSLDMIVPFAKGGAFTADNVQLLCTDCNLLKRQDIIDFRRDRV